MEGWVESRTCLELGKESGKTLLVVYPTASPTPSLARWGLCSLKEAEVA